MIFESDSESQFLQIRVEFGVLALPERERTILLYRFFVELTQSEIAEKAGLSQMHVSRLLSQSLKALRRELGNTGS